MPFLLAIIAWVTLGGALAFLRIVAYLLVPPHKLPSSHSTLCWTFLFPEAIAAKFETDPIELHDKRPIPLPPPPGPDRSLSQRERDVLLSDLLGVRYSETTASRRSGWLRERIKERLLPSSAERERLSRSALRAYEKLAAKGEPTAQQIYDEVSRSEGVVPDSDMSVWTILMILRLILMVRDWRR